MGQKVQLRRRQGLSHPGEDEKQQTASNVTGVIHVKEQFIYRCPCGTIWMLN